MQISDSELLNTDYAFKVVTVLHMAPILQCHEDEGSGIGSIKVNVILGRCRLYIISAPL